MASSSLSASEKSPIISPKGFVHVLGFSPTEGERGVPITVRIHCQADSTDVFVRLLISNTPVETEVKQLPDVDYGRWQLQGSVPSFDSLESAATKVSISVQALSEDNTVLDSVTFGEFCYWSNGKGRRRSVASIGKLPRLQIPDSAALRRRAAQNLPTPSPTGSDRSHHPKSPKKSALRANRRIKSGTIARTRHNNHTEPDDLYAHTPILDLVTPLSSICGDWSDSELSVGRRLVRFTKVQDGCKLIVSCEPISQDEFQETEIVISCIFRESTEFHYVTSVDVIYLLERLTNGDFPVEEKNRIRRNLEGLRPTTVSKHKPGFGDFFQRIMEFPDPKPRNIEKDLKVFEWSLLSQALEKILSKYSIYTSGPNTAESSPVLTPNTAHSPQILAPPLSYGTLEPSRTSRLDHESVLAKLEPLPDFITHSPVDAGGLSKELFDSQHCFPSPVDTHASISSPTSSTYPYPDSQNDDCDLQPQDRSPWGPHCQDYDASFDQYTTLGSYETNEPVFTHDSAYGYDNFSCTVLSNEALATLAGQYL
ncbi:hypothetical protein CPB83DRAFT_927452 [Crepidotus variabilis]|uniref:DUF7082 domain-containing protein n=1 Tax=Crepidotus variabilis TaxID=179855 RepID=A0A9P6EI40_9AGAR|nr:hypothetical protein CPB83DRAFT_927452 [Crepidotus variabilis]